LAPQTAPIGKYEEERIVKRILVAYLKAKSDQKSVAPPYGARGEWDSFIRTGKREYVAALERSEVEDLSRLLRNFFRNTGADGLLTISSYSQIAAANTRRKMKFVHYLLQDYYNWKDLTGNTSPRPLGSPAIGNAWGYIIDNQLVMPGACRHNYFAHQARLLLSEVEGGVPVVAEIGGGFGGLAYFLLSSGANCRYVNFDLPEILVVEQYYLMSAFPEKNFLLYGEQPIDFGPALESFDVILMPNFELPKLPDDSVDLFINTGSLSEMDYATVEEYIRHITRACRLYFFHDNSDREVPIGTIDVVVNGETSLEVPSSRFPILEKDFRRIYKAKSPWVCMGDRMREHLYRRISPTIPNKWSRSSKAGARSV
jgi:hypothetical protein